jgi:molecular chaperone GrpE
MTEETKPEEQKEQDSAATPSGESSEQQIEGLSTDQMSVEIDELRSKLAEAEKATERFKDQLLRKAAEFENYRRRSDAEYAALIKSANENLLLGLLPVLDDFARSLKAGKDQKEYDSFYRGVELIHSKLTRILESEGLKAFESTGKPFDVEYHDALLQIPRADVPPHTVIEEVERGYMLHDRVLRHARVVVSIAPEESKENESGADELDEKEPNG